MSDVGFRVQDLGFRVWSFVFWKEILSAGRPPGRHCKTQKTLEKRSESQHLWAAPSSWPHIYIYRHISRMRSEGSRFTWGSGGEAVFAKSCVCDRNHPQPSATVGNRPCVRRKALHSGERVWSAPESMSS